MAERQYIEDTLHTESLPVNAKAMLNRLREIMDDGATNHLDCMAGANRIKARKVLWLLMTQVYGQLACLDLSDEWSFLNKFPPGEEGKWESVWEGATEDERRGCQYPEKRSL